MRYGFEDREIEPFRRDGAIEPFDVCVLRRLAGLYKQQPDPIIIHPLPEYLAEMFAAIIQA